MAITKVDLANVVTGVLPVANGGTGTSTGVAPGGSDRQVQFNNAGAFGGSANFVFDGTNVGIGTSSPSTKLDVTGTSRYTFNVANAYTLQTALNAAGNAFADDYKNALSHIWQTSGTDRMIINSSGNVGIGTTSPKSLLSVTGDVNGLNESSFAIKHYQQASSTYTASQIQSVISGASAYLTFSTNSNWTNGNAVEALRIGSAGQLGIGGANYGTSGQALVSNGSGSAPSWQTVSSAPTTAQVLSATAGASAGDVGTYALMYLSGLYAVKNFNDTASGSYLFNCSAAADAVSPRAGTWRCMGYANGNYTNPTAVTVWLRIS